MKFRKPLLAAVTGGALLFSAFTMAQDAPASAPSSTMPASSPSTMPQRTGTVRMQTAAGELTVHSTMPAAAPAGPAPSFEQLSGGEKSISEAQAAAYPLLANDFDYADRNRDKHISRSEYKNWTGQK